MGDIYFYIPINNVTHTLILGLYNSKKDAENACITYLKYHKNFEKVCSSIKSSFLKHTDEEVTVNSLKKILFCEDTSERDYDRVEFYELIKDTFGLGFTIWPIRQDKDKAKSDIINMIYSHDGWVEVAGKNQLELLISYKFGYTEEYNVDLHKLAQEYPVI